MFKDFIQILKALTTNSDSGAIACAFSCGIILGLIPKGNLLWIILFVFIFFMRIDRIVFSLSILLGALIAPAFDIPFDTLGCFILTLPAVEKMMTTLLEIPFFSFTKLNNSIVCASFLCGIVLYTPLYYLAKLVIFLWRKYVAKYFRKLNMAKWLKKVPLAKKIASKVG